MIEYVILWVLSGWIAFISKIFGQTYYYGDSQGKVIRKHYLNNVWLDLVRWGILGLVGALFVLFKWEEL